MEILKQKNTISEIKISLARINRNMEMIPEKVSKLANIKKKLF